MVHEVHSFPYRKPVVPSPFVKKIFLSLIKFRGSPCQKSADCISVVLFLNFLFSPSVCLSVLRSTSHCITYCSFIVSSEISTGPLAILFSSRNAILGPGPLPNI